MGSFAWKFFKNKHSFSFIIWNSFAHNQKKKRFIEKNENFIFRELYEYIQVIKVIMK